MSQEQVAAEGLGEVGRSLDEELVLDREAETSLPAFLQGDAGQEFIDSWLEATTHRIRRLKASLNIRNQAIGRILSSFTIMGSQMAYEAIVRRFLVDMARHGWHLRHESETEGG